MIKEKNLKLFLIFLIIIILTYLFFLVNQNDNKRIETENIFTIKEEKINHCKIENDTNCKYNDLTYKYLTLKKSYQNLQPIITSLNQLVNQKKENMIKSNLNNENCNNAKSTYIYRTINILDEYLYTSNNIIGIAYNFESFDVCTNKKENSVFNSYIYNTKKDKILTKEEILNLYHIKDENIQQAINKNIVYWNQANSTNYTIKDINNNYKLYLSNEGNLEVFYTLKQENTTYSTIIKSIS